MVLNIGRNPFFVNILQQLCARDLDPVTEIEDGTKVNPTKPRLGSMKRSGEDNG
jgi:hypothetical protein